MSDLHRSDESRVAAYKNSIFDDSLVLAYSIVIANDGARANIYAGADFRISQVGEVIGFRARTHRGLFQLHEISDLCPLAHHRFWSEMSERTHRRALCNT